MSLVLKSQLSVGKTLNFLNMSSAVIQILIHINEEKTSAVYVCVRLLRFKYKRITRGYF